MDKFACDEPPAALFSGVGEAPLRAHTRFVGDPLLEGRLPGSRGETITAKYVESHLACAGVLPAGDAGSFFQPVPLVHLLPQSTGPATVVSHVADDAAPCASVSMQWATEYVGSTELDSGVVKLSAEEMVFVGYGIQDASLGWDDYKGVDVRDKVVVSLVSQPKTSVWEGKKLAYPGRWTYKFEEAARRGAKAVLLVHTTETASYPWTVVKSSWSGTTTNGPCTEKPLEFMGWMTQEKADEIARMSGSSLAQWFESAQSKQFSPAVLSTRVSLELTFKMEPFSGTNVVGMIKGALYPEEAIIVSAHIDHLGIRPSDGAVYCGALDNGSGVAVALASAVSFAHSVASGAVARPSRTIVFLFPTAEESGLLGSEYFVKSPPTALKGSRFLADINLDICNAWGLARDCCLIGQQSTLVSVVVPWACAGEGLEVSGDPTPPTSGFLFRGDQFSFARAGVPSLWLFTGSKFVGQPDDYGAKAVFAKYIGCCYHQPSDVFSDALDFGGVAQQARVVLRTVYGLAYTKYVPEFF